MYSQFPVSSSTLVSRARHIGRTGILSATVLFVAVVIGSAVRAAPPPDSFADLADKLVPAVVNISTTQTIKMPSQQMPQFPPGSPFEEFFKEFFDRRGGEDMERKATSLGSGFIIRSSGVVVTNNHVIADADEIVVTTGGGEEYEATIIGRDSRTDIALLRVESEEKLPALEFGDSASARVGDWVISIGNPYGLGGSVTAGIVSARGRNINIGPYDDFIQTDAAINRGNSGGPLIDMSGKVVGVNTAIFSPTGGSVGIGFAIPANMVQHVVSDLLEFGTVKRGWLGISLQSVTPDIAESLDLDEARGALVARVIEGDPAEKAGMKTGDVILKFDGTEIEDADELPRVVADTPIGKKVEVVVWRNGREKELDVTIGQMREEEVSRLEQRPEGKPQPGLEDETVLGMKLAPLSEQVRQQFDIPKEVEGVIVTDVAGDSDAARRGIRPGVVIVQIGQESDRKVLTSVAQMAERIRTLRSKGQKFALFRIYAQGKYLWVPVKIEE